MFFQTSAPTVGMTKNGEMTRTRTMPWPADRLVEQQRQADAADDGDQQHAEPTSSSVLRDAPAKKAGSVRKYWIVRQNPTKPLRCRVSSRL